MKKTTNRMIKGDCLKTMLSIKDKSIDLILTDLPYGTTAQKEDVIIPFDKLWEQYNRIIKNNGVIALFGQEPFSSNLRLSNIKNYKYDWYWQKERPTNVLQLKRRAGKVIETISIFYNKQPIYNPQKTKHDGKLRTNKVKNGSLGKLIDSGNKKAVFYRDDRTRFPLQLIKFKRDILKSNLHPTQKPVALLEYLIKTYTNKSNLVLDNCAGSFSTIIACDNFQRNWIGIEKEKKYCDIGLKRINENRKLLSLPLIEKYENL